MEWLIAAAVVLVGYGTAKYLKGAKLPTWLNLTPAGASPAAQTQADQVATNGIARGAALSLYGYLKAHGEDGSAAFQNLVLAFQSMSNTDPQAMALTGPLPPTGNYDDRTSAALTLYTHDPVPPAGAPAPKAPPPPALIVNMAIPGDAATSAFNLFTYLHGHGNDKSVALQKLVQQFQIDVNHDPKAPGPANQTGLPTAIKAKLAETGVYDAPTAAALLVFSGGQKV